MLKVWHLNVERARVVESIGGKYRWRSLVQYPMYLMPMPTLLAFEKMAAHQALEAEGKLVKYTSETRGRVVFISHQWLGHKHPDPAGEQLDVLQRVLQRLMEVGTSRAAAALTEAGAAELPSRSRKPKGGTFYYLP